MKLILPSLTCLFVAATAYNVLYDSMDRVFRPRDREIARIPFGDVMAFSMDITVNSLPTHSKFANVMFCGTSMPDRQFIVAMNKNSNDPANDQKKGFRVFVPADGSSDRHNTFAIDEGKTYHLDVMFSQSSLAIVQDGVLVYADNNYSKHQTYDSVPCYIGNPDKDNENYDADVTVRNIVIKGEKPKKNPDVLPSPSPTVWQPSLAPTFRPTKSSCPSYDDFDMNAPCDYKGRCEFGEETCCGKTHPSLVCQCGGDRSFCYYTDACMVKNCGDRPRLLEANYN